MSSQEIELQNIGSKSNYEKHLANHIYDYNYDDYDFEYESGHIEEHVSESSEDGSKIMKPLIKKDNREEIINLQPARKSSGSSFSLKSLIPNFMTGSSYLTIAPDGDAEKKQRPPRLSRVVSSIDKNTNNRDNVNNSNNTVNNSNINHGNNVNNSNINHSNNVNNVNKAITKKKKQKRPKKNKQTDQQQLPTVVRVPSRGRPPPVIILGNNVYRRRRSGMPSRSMPSPYFPRHYLPNPQFIPMPRQCCCMMQNQMGPMSYHSNCLHSHS